MNRVLLASTYFYRLDPKQLEIHRPYPPLGTLQAAAVVREAGFDVSVFDAGLKGGPEELGAELDRCRPAFLVLYDDGFNYLTKMCLTVMREAAFTMARLGQERGATVIVNSSDASDHAEAYLREGVDYVIRGEGEETLRELLETLAREGPVEELPGLVYVRDGALVRPPLRPVLGDLDSLPLPAWDLIDLEPYRRIWVDHHGYFSLNVATTRGCPFKCNWCAKPIYGNRYHSRSPGHVVAELAHLLDRYRPDHFWMCDDIFGLKPGWVRQFRDLVQARGLRFGYKIQSRVDLLCEEGAVRALVESGAETVWVGAESGSQKVLDAMDKGTTVAQIRRATALLRRHGARVAYFLQFGYPGETLADIQDTLRMVLEELPDEIGISVSYPLPGTPFYERVREQLKAKQNWVDSDDLAAMHQATFPPAFYRCLHRYVHSRYRTRRGWVQLCQGRASWRALASMLVHAPLALVQRWQLRRLRFRPADPRLPVSAAFTRQASHFDEEEARNPILPLWRARIHRHLQAQLAPAREILELNAGTGIDAIQLASQGHRVHATDLSEGMVSRLQEKVGERGLQDRISVQQLSYEDLDRVQGSFDVVFSNFGGLNCIDDLRRVTRHLPALLRPGGLVTWVIMPRICPWEWLWLLKGRIRQAFRRISSRGAPSHLEGHYFLTHYFSLDQIRKAMPDGYVLVGSESLGCLSPPPSATRFAARFPALTRLLNRWDEGLGRTPPFSRWGDHLIVTFRGPAGPPEAA